MVIKNIIVFSKNHHNVSRKRLVFLKARTGYFIQYASVNSIFVLSGAVKLSNHLRVLPIEGGLGACPLRLSFRV